MKRTNLLFDPAPVIEGETSTGAGLSALDAGSPATETPIPAAQPSATPVPSPSPTPSPAAPATPPAPAQLTPEAIAAAVKAAMPQPQAAPAAPTAPPTAEELAQLFHVHNVSQQDVVDLLAGGDQAMSALVRMRDGVVKQALTMAGFHIEHKIEQLAKQYGFDELHGDLQSRRLEKLESEFFTKYPDLKGHKPLVYAFGNHLKQQGFKGTQEEAFAKVAELAKAALAAPGASSVPPGSTPGQGSPQPSAPAVPTMPVLSNGGQGGAGGTPSGGGGKKSPGLDALS